MQIVPLQPDPNQTLAVLLGTQSCQLNVYQKSTGLFMDVLVDNDLVIGGVLCLNNVRIVRSLYLGFQGDFSFIDTQGDADPDYTGLGGRYLLRYIEPADLPPGVG